MATLFCGGASDDESSWKRELVKHAGYVLDRGGSKTETSQNKKSGMSPSRGYSISGVI